ncbi:MAG: PKD domain-containing protein [Flavobacteriales bacterium]|nr:PKD domain-containing protein [Flavobacteriales bacterium]
MRLIPLALFAGLALTTMAQDPPFERHFTIPGALEIYGATRDDLGNYYIANETVDEDIQVTCLSASGEHQWTRAYPFFTEDGLYGNSIAVGPEGLVLAGYTIGSVTNSRDGVVLHIGLDGTLISSTRIDAGGGSNALHYLSRTSDGFIASGRGPGEGSYDMLLAKLDNEGNMLWSKTFGTSGWDWGYEAKELSDGGYALIGYGDGLGTGFSPSGYLVRTDALGNEMWARSISSGSGVDEAYTVVQGTNGDLYVGGRSLGFILGDVTAYITKISSTGDPIWTRKLEQGIEAYQLHPTANGGVAYLAHPQYMPGAGGDYDIAWGTFDASGNLLTSHLYGGPASDNGMVFFQNDDGGYSIIGMSNPALTADFIGLLLVTDANGDVDCNNIDLALNWTTATATVAPFTSTTGSGFTAYPYTLGQTDVVVSTTNPCCNEAAAFTMVQQANPYTWQFLDASIDANTYLWDFGDGNTSTEVSPTHTYAANGNYTVCLTISGDCGDATACQAVGITVGISEAPVNTHGLSLAPSPANDLIVVRSEGAAIAQVQLLDAEGRLVSVTEQPRSVSLMMPVAHLPAGMYAARVSLTDGTVQHLRVVVAH